MNMVLYYKTADCAYYHHQRIRKERPPDIIITLSTCCFWQNKRRRQWLLCGKSSEGTRSMYSMMWVGLSLTAIFPTARRQQFSSCGTSLASKRRAGRAFTPSGWQRNLFRLCSNQTNRTCRLILRVLTVRGKRRVPRISCFFNSHHFCVLVHGGSLWAGRQDLREETQPGFLINLSLSYVDCIQACLNLTHSLFLSLNQQDKCTI